MSALNLPDDVLDETERIAIVVVDALRWDESAPIRQTYPPGLWFRGTAPATTTPQSLTSLFSGLSLDHHGADGAGVRKPVGELLSVTDSVSMAVGTKRLRLKGRILASLSPKKQESLAFHNLIPESERPGGETGPVTEQIGDPSIIGDHNLAFLHDLIIHNSAPDPNAPLSLPTWDPSDRSRSEYRRAVRLSASAHGTLLDRLRDAGLFDTTLFIVLADHGEIISSTRFAGPAGHDGAVPFPGIARVPVGFAHSQLEKTRVDTDTNPRLTDLAPTVARIMGDAGLGVKRDRLGPTDGVDLRTENEPFTGRCRQTFARPDREPDRSAEAVVGPDGLAVDCARDGSPGPVGTYPLDLSEQRKTGLRERL
jgi:hypothetical protein